MVDFHCHILPGIDDGSRNIEMTEAMLEEEARQGVTEICATPHFYADFTTPRRFLRARKEAFDSLCEAREEQDTPEILLGAEVRFFDGISAAEELQELCLEGTDLLLLEMPFTRWTDRMLTEVEELSRRGLQPVAAHIERYFGFNSDQLIRRFMDSDILIQCNAEFFLERRTSRVAMKLMKEERIHFLGSDAHNNSTRSPNLAKALERIEHKLGPEALERIRAIEDHYLGKREPEVLPP